MSFLKDVQLEKILYYLEDLTFKEKYFSTLKYLIVLERE
jgi:hypothetical protein